jgi:excisionase family DNA binding protein
MTPTTPAATPPDSRLLTREQAMEFLQISETTLWQLTRAGELRPTRIGRAVRYSRRELERFVSRQTR